MTFCHRSIVALLLLVCLQAAPATPCAMAGEQDCSDALARVEQRNGQISADLHRLHREIAALRSDLAQPGLTEILGGIGYIIGLFGLYAWARSKPGTSQRRQQRL